jgi:hypothetical protein
MQSTVQAWNDIPKAGRPSVREFCDQKEVPRATFQRWLKNGKQVKGRPAYLSQSDKENMHALILRQNRRDDSLKMKDIHDVLKTHGVFSDLRNGPSRTFLFNTLNEIKVCERQAKTYDPTRYFAEKNPKNFEDFFSQLRQVYEEYPLLKEEPGRMINIVQTFAHIMRMDLS